MNAENFQKAYDLYVLQLASTNSTVRFKDVVVELTGADRHTVNTAGAKHFAVSVFDMQWLFKTGRTLAELRRYAAVTLEHKDRVALDGRDAKGYDANGYDKDGYGEDGYDRDGFDREGYDIDGLNKDER